MKRADDNAAVRYLTGFGLSVALTSAAYVAALDRNYARPAVIGLVAVLGAVQLAVQLTFFLHLDEEARPRTRLLALGFAALVAGIVGGGSLWIVGNLNRYHPLQPQEADSFIRNDEGIGR